MNFMEGDGGDEYISPSLLFESDPGDFLSGLSGLTQQQPQPTMYTHGNNTGLGLGGGNLFATHVAVDVVGQSQGDELSLGLSQGTQQQIVLDAFGPGDGNCPEFLETLPDVHFFGVGDDGVAYNDNNCYVQSRSIIGNKPSTGNRLFESNGEQFVNPGASSALPQQNTYQEEEISSSQSSDVSLESTIPCLEPWAGVHNFEAKIEQLGVNFNKKGAYNQQLNKLYCFNKVPILFNFHTSCDRSLMKQMNVKAMLVFSDSAYRTVPVERCITCLSQEATSEKKVLTDLDENSIHQHVLQCHHEQAVYEKSNVQKRFSVTVPLERPQMGSSIVSRNFEFKCLNTCEGVKRRALSLVFLLLHNQKPVGRSVINLKVCACPKRDCDHDKKRFLTKSSSSEKKARKRGSGNEKRLLKRIPEDEKLDLLDVAAKQRCVSPLTVAGLNIKTEPGTSHGHGRGGGGGGHTSSRCERKVLLEATDESEQESFSQCSQGTLVKKVADTVKMFHDASKSPNPRDQTFAKNSLGLIKVFLKNGEFYRTSESPSSSAKLGGGGTAAGSGKEDNNKGHGSPDSGVNAKTP